MRRAPGNVRTSEGPPRRRATIIRCLDVRQAGHASHPFLRVLLKPLKERQAGLLQPPCPFIYIESVQDQDIELDPDALDPCRQWHRSAVSPPVDIAPAD